MTEIKEHEESKPRRLSRPGKLELKRTVETGQVRQSFSHGRSKMVTVEVRKKRTYAPDSGGHMAEVRHDPDQVLGDQEEDASLAEADGVAREGTAASLTSEEKAARVRALQDAKKTEDELPEEEQLPVEPAAEEVELAVEAEEPVADSDAEVAEDSDTQRAEEEAREETEREEAERAEAERVAMEVTELEAKQRETKSGAAAAKTDTKADADDAEQRNKAKRTLRADAKRPTTPVRRGEARRRSGKLTISEALEDRGERVRSLAAVKRAREREKQRLRQEMPAESHKVIRDVVVPETITVQELSNRMAERGADVIKVLMKMGVMATITQTLDADTAELVVSEFGHNVRRVSDADVEIGLRGEEDEDEHLVPRPPVVTVMGHVDHGKTSLLDALRQTDVASHEAGGITQHIGAYQVTTPDGARITFIDTPGHAAFTDMRARGANVTDIVVLVVAADDGVMPQTIEAIRHAQVAGVPIIVAVNKIDRPDADSNRVRTELLQHDIVVEEMGGEVLSVDVSAKEKTNLDRLEELILLQAELLDLRSNPDRNAEGVVVESKMERGRGSVGTVLVQRGTLCVGDIFVAGSEWGRVRGLVDATGTDVEEAGPGMPVEVLGLNGTPAAGDEVTAVESESRAREITDFRRRKQRDAKAAASGRGSLEQMFTRIQEGEAEELPVVVKGDVHGSVETIVSALEKLSTDEVKAQVLHAAVGGINESDVTLARASDAMIIGFNVRANPQARELAKRDSVAIRYYSIIYDVTDDLKTMMSGLLAPKLRENMLGYAEVREVFNITKVGKVAGCMVTEGMIRRGARVRLLRDDVVIHEGDLSQLKRFKDDVKEVKEGYDCGAAFANYNDIQIGDLIECFEIEEVAREL